MFPYLPLVLLFSSLALIQSQDIPEPFQVDTSSLVYFTKLNLILVDNGEQRARRNVTLTASQKATEVEFNKTNGKFVLSASPVGQQSDLSVTTFNLRVNLKVLNKQYWSISNLVLSADGTSGGQMYDFKEIPLISSVDPTAPLKMSFHCSKFGPWVGVVDKTNFNFTPQVEFRNFQMEAFMKDNSKFGPSYDCVGFFSIGIWSGIFVTIILLSILSWGITMVMSVKTMDRFDDVKSKPISVGTAD